MDTFKSLGYHMTEDPFSGKPMAGFNCLDSIDLVTKERSYAVPAYYVPVKERPNLHVLTGANVEKILFDNNESKLRAIGVQFQQNGDPTIVNARKEVIFAADSLNPRKYLSFLVSMPQSCFVHVKLMCVSTTHTLETIFRIMSCVCSGSEVKDHVCTLDDLARKDPRAISGNGGIHDENAALHIGWGSILCLFTRY